MARNPGNTQFSVFSYQSMEKKTLRSEAIITLGQVEAWMGLWTPCGSEHWLLSQMKLSSKVGGMSRPKDTKEKQVI